MASTEKIRPSSLVTNSPLTRILYSAESSPHSSRFSSIHLRVARPGTSFARDDVRALLAADLDALPKPAIFVERVVEVARRLRRVAEHHHARTARTVALDGVEDDLRDAARPVWQVEQVRAADAGHGFGLARREAYDPRNPL